MTYCIRLHQFTGPLDLLLYLVRRQEIDIVDLPIAELASQFLEFLAVLEILDLDLVGDFVVMASTLIEIKSRSVLPSTDETPQVVEPIEDPRAELVQRLIEYKRFKEAAGLLEERAADWQTRFPRLSHDRPQAGNNPAQDRIKEVELWDLVSALSRILRSHPESAPKSIVYDETPISTYIERIQAQVLAEGRCTFSSFFAGSPSRSRIVGVFLAILELLRHYGFRAEQPIAYGEIWILPPVAPREPAASHPVDARMTTE